MKFLKLSFFLVLSIPCIFSINACKKDKKYTVKGRVLESCDNPVPVKNLSLSLFNSGNTSGNCKGTIKVATTNENGDFLFEYESSCGKGSCKIETNQNQNSVILADLIRLDQSEDLGNLFVKNNGFYLIKIKTNNAFAKEDTLYYDIRPNGSSDSVYKFKNGPFVDGEVVDTLFETVWKLHFNPANIENHIMDWILKSNQIVYAKSGQGQGFYIEPCKKYNEVVLDISK